MCSNIQGNDFSLRNYLFDAVQLTKNADPDKYSCSRYYTGFDINGRFSLLDGKGFGKNVILFDADTSSSVHIDNRRKYILTLGKGTTDGLYDTTMTAEKAYSIILQI